MVLGFYLLYLTAALLCLRQWGTTEPWSRIDFFSGGFFFLAPLWMMENLFFARSVGSTSDVRQEALGTTYDPGLFRWVPALTLGELLVFADYGHWRLAPALVHPFAQGIGLLLWGIAPLWLVWTNRYLGAHFSKPKTEWKLLTEGPFRWLRHPRYTALVGSRLAFALIFGSILGFGFAAAWVYLILRRIRLEEDHLSEQYGEAYERYRAKTKRLLPYVY